MSNITKPDRIARIVEMSRAGASTREIATTIGVSNETVRRYSDSGRALIRDLRKKLDAFVDDLALSGIDAGDFDTFHALHAALMFACVRHPFLTEDEMDRMMESNRCPRCVFEGTKRHHARRKAEGCPIVPPWHSSRKKVNP